MLCKVSADKVPRLLASEQQRTVVCRLRMTLWCAKVDRLMTAQTSWRADAKTTAVHVGLISRLGPVQADTARRPAVYPTQAP